MPNVKRKLSSFIRNRFSVLHCRASISKTESEDYFPFFSHPTILTFFIGGDEPLGSQVPSMFFNFIGSEIDWKYNTEPEQKACLSSPEQRCYWPRGKVLGGTSVINGMMYIRGNKEDYDDWEAMGNPGWSYNDILPYFLKSEDNLQIDEVGRTYHRTGGLLSVSKFPYHPPLSYALLRAGQELGIV